MKTAHETNSEAGEGLENGTEEKKDVMEQLKVLQNVLAPLLSPKQAYQIQPLPSM